MNEGYITMNPNLTKIASFFFALLPWAVFSFQNVGRLQSPSSSSFPAVVQRSPRALHLSTTTTGDGDDDGSVTRISIEYCTGCRWMLKSFWMAQELLTTFEDEIDAITIIPSSTKGIYSIRLSQANTLGPEISKRTLLWDRKEKGGFPSPKVLKQIVRDNVTPEKYLGHSDTKQRQDEAEEGGNTATTNVDGDEDKSVEDNEQPGPWPWATTPTPAITITYCTGCKWLLRAAYFGQELLTTFGEEIKSVTLLPSKPPAKGGQFSVTLDGELIFDRATEGRFPEVKEIKQMIRDKISPDKDLGHSDVAVAEIDDMD